MARKEDLSPEVEFRGMCFHEAGHAVACYLYRIPIRHVTVEPDGKYQGLVSYHIVRIQDRLEDLYLRRSRDLAERYIRICLAGEIAQKKYSKKSFRPYHSKYDWDKAVNVAAKFSASSKEAVAWCHYLYLRTQFEITREYEWRAISALARTLKIKKRITGKEARRIIQSALAI